MPPAPEDSSDLVWPGLMAAAQSGDGAAYRRLLKELAPYLRNVARKYHRDPRDCEDSVQDILLTIHQIRHTYDPARPIRPWLVAIAKRRIIDRLRSQRRHREGQEILVREAETFLPSPTNTEMAESDAEAMHQAIRQLPDGQREAVTLLKIRELSLKEASAQSGLSIASLKISSHRAIKALRGMLDKRSDGT